MFAGGETYLGEVRLAIEGQPHGERRAAVPAICQDARVYAVSTPGRFSLPPPGDMHLLADEADMAPGRVQRVAGETLRRFTSRLLRIAAWRFVACCPRAR